MWILFSCGSQLPNCKLSSDYAWVISFYFQKFCCNTWPSWSVRSDQTFQEEINAGRHISASPMPPVMALKRHFWLCMTALPFKTYCWFKDLPFEESTLFSHTTNEFLSTVKENDQTAESLSSFPLPLNDSIFFWDSMGLLLPLIRARGNSKYRCPTHIVNACTCLPHFIKERVPQDSGWWASKPHRRSKANNSQFLENPAYRDRFAQIYKAWQFTWCW